MRAWRGPSIPPPSSPEPLRADAPCRESPFVGMGIRERLVLPLARQAPDVRETPTGGLLFPGGENLLSAPPNMSTMRATCPRTQSRRRASFPALEQPALEE